MKNIITLVVLAAIAMAPAYTFAQSIDEASVSNIYDRISDYLDYVNEAFSDDSLSGLAAVMSETDKLHNWLVSVSKSSNDIFARNLAAALSSRF